MALGLNVKLVKPSVQIVIKGYKFTDVKTANLLNTEPSNCNGLLYLSVVNYTLACNPKPCNSTNI